MRRRAALAALLVLAVALVILIAAVASAEAEGQSQPGVVTSDPTTWTRLEAPTTTEATTTTTTAPAPTSTTTTTVPPVTTTTAAPAPQPAPERETPRVGACGGWQEEVAALWPAEQVSKACRVLMCESGGDPTVHNVHSTASGLFQFLRSTWGRRYGYAEAADAPPSLQLQAARDLWAASGWSPWVCS